MKYKRVETFLMDFEYLLGNNDEIIVKELAFVNAASVKPATFLLRAPYPRDQLTEFAKERMNVDRDHRHKLDWSSGDFPHTYLENVMLDIQNMAHVKIILINDKTKANFLKSYSSKVKYLKMVVDYNKLARIHLNCDFHSRRFPYCATQRVMQLNFLMTKYNLFE